MPKSSDTERFIAATFRSVWALELLLYLRGARDRSHSREDLVQQLRASDAVVSKSVDGLVAAGLVVEHDDGSLGYSPVSPVLEKKVEEAEHLYAARPDAVRRLIIASSAAGLAAFADAFKLKGDQGT